MYTDVTGEVKQYRTLLIVRAARDPLHSKKTQTPSLDLQEEDMSSPSS